MEFTSKARTFSRSVLLSQSHHSDNQRDDSFVTVLEKSNLNDDEKVSGGKEEDMKMPTSERENPPDKSNQFDSGRHVILFGKISGTQEVWKWFFKIQLCMILYCSR